MIMYDLVQGTAASVRVGPALDIVMSGPYWTSDFPDRDGRLTVAFWTVNETGEVCQVFEHTMGALKSLTASSEVRYFSLAGV
jgi:hypothetical protein